jgi:4-aminobutyrate aminotransferase-like enzyme
MAEHLSAGEQATLVRALAPLETDVAPREERLPRHVVHTDVTGDNVVGRIDADGRFVPTGVVDFGDVVHTWRVCDPAGAAAAAIALNSADALDVALAVLESYHARTPLEEAEAEAFWPVVLGRIALCAASSTFQLRQLADNPYVANSNRADWDALEAALAVPPAVARAAARLVCGFAAAPATAALPSRVAAARPAPLIAGLSRDRLVPVDLTVASERLVEGRWHDVAVEAAGDVHPIAVGRWGEARLPHAGAPSETPPTTLHLGADLFVDAGTAVCAPLAGRIVRADAGELVLACPVDGADAYIRLAGVTPRVEADAAIERGEVVGDVAEADGPLPAHLHVQLAAAPGLPGVGDARLRDAWLAACPDPSPLVGIDVAAPADASAAAKRDRRGGVVAGAQGLYYRAPMEMVRGWRQHLYDADARAYLDMVNNVAAVGHSHPRVTAAAVRQFQLLNTNSRFLYEAMTEYAERVSALLPDELDTVFLVNSGSEAVDLALQLARTATGRHDIAAIEGAYHGWTGSVYEACTSPQDNPSWRQAVPAHVHVVEQPNPYRGAHGDDGGRYADSLREACAAAEAHGGLAAFVSEALLGNQGGVEPARGYLAEAYATVRAAGGVCIADEVQVGYGRTGSHFWAFEHEGVVPDIVTVAKATGNGHPLGVVVCRREIADALGRRASFFSSTGGGPVSCRIGVAVLDVIRDERLQENAAVVGGHLKRRLEELARDFAEIGAVHGRGLYLGVDLVRDRATREPAPEAAAAICERMRELGVIVQPTGDAYNVLKVKPPMCLGIEDADVFADALAKVLGERARNAVLRAD